MTVLWWVRGMPAHLADEHQKHEFTAVGPDLAERDLATVAFAGGEPYDGAVLDSLPNLSLIHI